MRLLSLMAVATATLTAVAATDAATDAATEAAMDLKALAAVMPPCALQCMSLAIKESGCPITNQTCICTNPVLTNTMTVCVSTHCTIKEALTTQNITSTACHAPIRDRSSVVSISGVVGGGLAVMAFLLRMASRLPYFGGRLGWDDLVIFVTILLTVPLAALSVVLADLGLGRDIWTVPFDNITDLLHVYFYSEWLYISILPLTKISILLFYLRIFPRRGFRIATYILIAINAAYLITFVIVTVFQCRPIDGAWLRWDGTHHYACNNENAQAWAAAGLNIIIDLATMILPLPELYSLNLSVRKRISVLGMFSLGIFVTLVSALRIHSLVQFSQSKNITWNFVDIGYWSVIEVDVGVICACLPAIRLLLRRCLPTAFGDTRQGTSMSRSNMTGSRLDDSVWPRPKGYDEINKVPLVDMGNKVALMDMSNSSEVRLAHGW